MPYFPIRYFPSFDKKPDMNECLFSRRNKKVKIVLKSISGISILKKNKIIINGNETLVSILNFLKKIYNKEEYIYLYINSTIKPNLDDYISDLFDLYQISNSLNISYSFNPAY
ncbi:autophagy-related protein 12, putative [Plasmodium yoelii]|uniref:Ubiquitin-like protein ATG12 n=2 Tax=Plasmodium yoelii TaxID=5861 RepID=A0AAE9WWZ6_PLAYO|nr:autophagy-related protein 12, putative [Plasmodium yoelii]WBY60080.1 autophagy-related protein 12 [Plasmodium yoelii yoelii]CDU19999.1 autophagy-related protein 12, putative [Plasmodium yoelii]VTZ80757.1 autophagy-related protein 12, putative [Plasmodium yoelii]|eukprot:XP_022813633.1 autophagy-related protein 12, putative [Plasmodium yoelii]